MRFTISSDPLQSPRLRSADAGGFVTFDGKVRNEHHGRRVVALEYEAYEEMAEAEGTRLLAEAIKRYQLIDAECVHRVGRLDVGDSAVVISVAAAHRRAAFEGCEFIIDELKKRVPIWKKEIYADGDSGWIGVSDQIESSDVLAQMFERQSRVPNVGPEGLAKLRQAKVLVVGAGALGTAAIPYLASAGIGLIGVVDFDRVELSHIHRQPLYGVRDVGRLKVDLISQHAQRLWPTTEVVTYPIHLTRENAPQLIADYDLILDATDKFSTNFLLNEACVAAQKRLIIANLGQFTGQLLTMDPTSEGGCLRCLWPTEPPEDDKESLGMVAGLLGIWQASEAIKAILDMDPAISARLTSIDLIKNEARAIERRRNLDCPVCGRGNPQA